MTPLHSLVALRTPADRNVKTPHPRAAHDLFLVLRLHPFDGQRPAASRALLGNRYLDLFVHMIWDGPLVMRAMGGAGLTSRTSGLTLGISAGERSGLAPTGTLRSFQFFAQPVDFILESLALLLQPLLVLRQTGLLSLQLLVSPAGLVTLLPRTAQLLGQFPDAAERVERFEKQIII